MVLEIKWGTISWDVMVQWETTIATPKSIWSMSDFYKNFRIVFLLMELVAGWGDLRLFGNKGFPIYSYTMLERKWEPRYDFGEYSSTFLLWRI